MKLSKYTIRYFFIAVIAALGLTYIGTVLDRISGNVEKISSTQSQEESKLLRSEDIDYSDGQTIYVPAYSQIPMDDKQTQGLRVFLSVRNSDPKNVITFSRIDYYDTKGNLVKQYADEDIVLAPFETVEYFIDQKDFSGGSGANFFLKWTADDQVYQPYVEALMYGVYGNASFSFKSRGLVFSPQKTE